MGRCVECLGLGCSIKVPDIVMGIFYGDNNSHAALQATEKAVIIKILSTEIYETSRALAVSDIDEDENNRY